MRYLLIGILFMLGIFNLSIIQAQTTKNSPYSIRGRVLDSTSYKAVSFAQIYNESTKNGVSSDELGVFNLEISKGDTLVILDVAYWSKVIIIDSIRDNQEIVIFLTPQFHEIEEVDITQFRSYKHFQHQVLHHELEETETDILEKDLDTKSTKAAVEIAQIIEDDKNTQPGQTRIYSIPLYYKAVRQQRNYQKVIKLEQKQSVIDKKYNREIIYEITKLSEEEATDFIGFCDFKMSFLLEATEYDIRTEIEEKFKEFSQ